MGIFSAGPYSLSPKLRRIFPWSRIVHGACYICWIGSSSPDLAPANSLDRFLPLVDLPTTPTFSIWYFLLSFFPHLLGRSLRSSALPPKTVFLYSIDRFLRPSSTTSVLHAFPGPPDPAYDPQNCQQAYDYGNFFALGWYIVVCWVQGLDTHVKV